MVELCFCFSFWFLVRTLALLLRNPMLLGVDVDQYGAGIVGPVFLHVLLCLALVIWQGGFLSFLETA